MSLRQKIIPVLAAVTLTVLSLTGCANREGYPQETKREPAKPAEPKMVDYFANLPHSYGSSSPFAISEDFNHDGNNDLIIIQNELVPEGPNRTRAYFFEGDDKGNFTLKKYPVK